MQLIVARYNEDVSWTKQFPNVIIYNKGEPLGDGYNEQFLQNVGREGHTYYRHIYENYDNLSEYTIFVQGDPFPHCCNIIDILKKAFESDLDTIYNLYTIDKHSIFPLSNYILNETFNIQNKNAG